MYRHDNTPSRQPALADRSAPGPCAADGARRISPTLPTCFRLVTASQRLGVHRGEGCTVFGGAHTAAPGATLRGTAGRTSRSAAPAPVRWSTTPTRDHPPGCSTGRAGVPLFGRQRSN